MSRYNNRSRFETPSEAELKTIITHPGGAEVLVDWADKIGKALTQRDHKLSTSQIRALFGEVRQIQGEWSIDGHRDQALRRLILLKPKMAYRKRREGAGVEALVSVLNPALDLVVADKENQDDSFQRFVDFFEAILAYHKAYGGS